jgi:uncharacterized protein (DUF1501 family)
MPITRRAFMKGGAMAVVGTSVVPAFLTRSVLAQATTAQAQGKRLVVLFQRGAADGLNVVVPYAEKNYYAMRPTIAIQKSQVIDLNGFFGLHPEMRSLKPLWDQGHLAIVHAAGSPEESRSHFDAQDYMESGTPGVKATADGWLNRALRAEDVVSSAGHSQHHASAFRAVAMGTQLPRTLQGIVPAVAVGNVQDFNIGGKGGGGRDAAAQPASASFETMYAESVNSVLHGTGAETFDAVKMLRSADPAKYVPTAGADYPKGAFGDSMRQIAQLLKANLGVEAAFADIGGWDTHQNQGGATGQLANRLKEFSEGVAAFWTDMGDQAQDVVVVTMSEFGRTARQNGTAGTDHGHANVMFVVGGPVKGGKIYGKWPGLADEHLHEGRDLAITTDFRQVLGEAAYKTLGARNLDLVFPGARLKSGDFLDIVSV